MKHYFLLLLLFFPICAIAQVSDIVFLGTVSTSDGQVFSYKLQFTDSEGSIRGYSITDVMGPNETKTLIRGTIDKRQKQIRFRETRVLSTKTKITSKDDFLCFINGSLKVTSKKGTTILKGSFTGYKEDGKTECSSGKLMLVSAKDVMDILMKKDIKPDSITKKVLASEPEGRKTTTSPVKEQVAEGSVSKILPGSVRVIAVSGAIVKLNIWDAKTVDGDVISIMQNGRTILSKHMITEVYKELNVTLHNSDADTLKVMAINEGSEPLNTARIKITSGGDTQYVDASTTMDKPIWIVLKRN